MSTHNIDVKSVTFDIVREEMTSKESFTLVDFTTLRTWEVV